MSFINTVDILGDEALSNSIIDRSIVEISDGNITKVGPRAFMRCGALKRADFLNVNIIEDRAFMNAAQLETLILREDSVSLLNGVNHFNGTKIVSGTGYIYVPRALVDSYKADSKWSTYASQIRAIEDYPEVCDPYSWDTVKVAIERGTYKEWFKVGDCIPVDLGTYGIFNMQVAAFDADTLADGTGTAAITWISKETTGTNIMDSMGSPTYSALYNNTYVNMRLHNTILPALPQSATDLIQFVTKKSKAVDPDNDYAKMLLTLDLDVWLPSIREMGLSESWVNANITDGPQYSGLFPDNSSRVKQATGTTSAVQYWLRDAYSKTMWASVNTSGNYATDNSGGSHRLAFGFCTGRTPA